MTTATTERPFKPAHKLTRNGDPVETDGLAPGVYYLTRVTVLTSGGHSVRYVLDTQIQCANQSGEPRERGWLGCTNNVDRTACGRVRLERDASGRVRLASVAD